MGKIKHLRELSFKAAFALYFAVAIICATAAVYSLRLTADMIRGNIEWKYENLSARYAMPEGGSADTVYENDRASFVLRDADGTVTDRFSYSYSEAKLTTKLGAGGQVEFLSCLRCIRQRIDLCMVLGRVFLCYYSRCLWRGNDSLCCCIL